MEVNVQQDRIVLIGVMLSDGCVQYPVRAKVVKRDQGRGVSKAASNCEVTRPVLENPTNQTRMLCRQSLHSPIEDRLRCESIPSESPSCVSCQSDVTSIPAVRRELESCLAKVGELGAKW